MSLLTNKYREEIKNSKHADQFEEAQTDFGFSTGIDLLDYSNGKYIHLKNDDGYYSLGVSQGSYIMLIGKSGTSKTTIALQMAGNIIKRYSESTLFLDDIEAATDRTRIQNITGLSDEEYEEKVIHRNTGITSENFFENISMIAKQKAQLAKDYPEDFLLHTGKKDYNGDEIVIMPPTVYILDSLALLVPESLSEEERVSGQMSTTSTAKLNAKIFRQIIPKLKKANIILIAINHITQKIEINPMVHTKAQVNYLKQDESLVGGNTPIYLANNIFKLEAGSKLKDSELFGINGFTVNLTIIKSRSNRAGQTIELVYDQINGIDNTLSNLLYLKDNKILEGAGIGLHLPNSEVKFRLSTFKDKLKADKELRKLFRKTCILQYRKFINKNGEDIIEDEDNSGELVESTDTDMSETPVKKRKKK